MTKPKDPSTEIRISRLRQEKAVPTAVAPPASPVRHRRVGKAGAVHISGLRPGVTVKVISVDVGTYLVSVLPEQQVRELAASIPRGVGSPFAALSASLESRTLNFESPRVRGDYRSQESLPNLADSEILANADTRRTRRALGYGFVR